MKIIKLVLASIFVILTTNLHAQQCLTDHMFEQQAKQNPQLLKVREDAISTIPRNVQRRATKYIIPVVFHVIHTGGTENISFEQIENQMEILNKDFSLTNSDTNKIRSIFKQRASDAQVEFKLATLDPSGNCTNGVNRVFSPLHVNARNNVKSINGAYWDSKKYLNIWVVSSIENNSGQIGQILGFAQFPFTNSPATDGVVLRSDYVGSIGTGSQSHIGRTLTHEVGHWLGLFHTFQGGCLGGDGVNDTPPVASTFTNANCDPNSNSCSNDNPNEPDMYENYMDYSRGNCQSMFTADQKTRMHSNIVRYRSQLISMSNLTAAGIIIDVNQKPLAEFNSSTQIVCIGDTVEFNDLSCKGPVQTRIWTLTGSSSPSSSKTNPTVVYNTAGTYPVELVVSNGFGSSTKTEAAYIKVLSTEAERNVPYIVDFEKSTWKTDGALVIPTNSFGLVERVTDAGFSGNSSIKFPVNSFNNGVNFHLDLPALDMRGISSSNIKLSFYVGYAKRTTDKNESLGVYFSRNCGKKWDRIYVRSGSSISAKGATPINNFKPTSDADWKLIKINVRSFANDSNLRFRFEVQSNGGNPVYVDDINYSMYFSSVDKVDNQLGLNIYPNPSQGIVNVKLNKVNGPVSIRLLDLQGRVVVAEEKISPINGQIQHTLKKINQLNGTYFLQIRGKDFNIARSILIQK